MAKIYIVTKIILISAFNLTLIPAADAVTKVVPAAPPSLVFWIFVTLMMSLEVALVLSPGFREWLRSGVENGDGVLHSKDVNGLLIYYASLWFLRLFILNHLLKSFYGVPVDLGNQLLLFLGATGSQGVGILRTIVIRKLGG